MAPKKSAPAEAPKRRGRPPGSKNKSTLEKATKAPKVAKAAPKRLGRPPKAAAPKAAKSEAVRSAANGGHIPKERYAKDPKSVATRLKDKANKLLQQAANAVVAKCPRYYPFNRTMKKHEHIWKQPDLGL